LSQISDNRIKYYFQERTERAAARNKGIQLAKGEWIAFLDADDLWLPEKLENQFSAIKKFVNVGMIYSQAYLFNQRNLETGEADGVNNGEISGSGRPYPSNCLKEFLSGEIAVHISTVITRRELLLAIGGFDGQFTYPEDWDLFIRLAAITQVHFIDKPLAAYYISPGTNPILRGKQYKWHLQSLKVLEKNLTLTGLTETDPVFCSQARAIWEWRCAIVERNIENLESAKDHVIKGLGYQKKLLDQPQVISELIYSFFYIPGNSATYPRLKSELDSAIKDLLPISIRPDRFYRKCLAFLNVVLAFKAYQQNSAWQGLKHAIFAVMLEPKWILNPGLWSTAVRLKMRI
jgi:glycosyltransferase involved in cell wall biosynthesis